MAALQNSGLSKFLENLLEKSFNKALFCNFTNARYSFLAFCVICAKPNNLQVTSGYPKIFFSFLQYKACWKCRVLYFFKFKLTFEESFIKNHPFSGIFLKLLWRFTNWLNFTIWSFLRVSWTPVEYHYTKNEAFH